MNDALKELIARYEASRGCDLARPARLPLGSIREMPEVFQPRDGISEQHVSDLVKLIASVVDLDPIVILIVGDDYILTDGHHRLDAYRSAKIRPVDVPVTYFPGGPLEALIAGGAENGKVRLALSPRERQDFGWRLVLSEMLTRPQIETATGISRAQITLMRRAMTVLGDDADSYRSWFRARTAASGKAQQEFTDDDIETWKQQKADRYANEMARRFGTSMANDTEVAAMALAIHFGRRLEDLVRQLGYHLPEDFVMDEADGLF